ncbi:hypothetical protein [Chondromyces crocatus]|uniref:Lipoprotein n=1 Tax=Chondromyces crocatus TaxID=52 RepID=A0A0K1EMI1_CHOCO|nr:hypothetical protein [Chondromyces crocatus]AKT42105.1 uncharacterized protein CMC5_063290 [Chondromyces crocatus]
MRGLSQRAGWWGGALSVTFLVGCGSRGDATSPDDLPNFVQITVVDAKLGLGKSDGSQWDGLGVVPLEAIQDLAKAMSVIDRRAQIADHGIAILRTGIGMFNAPDAVGWAELVGADLPQTATRQQLVAEAEDTFLPVWRGPPTWNRVPFHASLALTGRLEDDDTPGRNDLIGNFYIPYDQLLAALRAQRVHQVQLSEQTHNQLLFIGVLVRPSS